MINVIFLAFGAMLFWGFSEFLLQKSSRDVGILESTAYIEIVGSILLFPFIIIEQGINYTFWDWTLFISIAAVSFIYTILIFKSLSIGKLSVIEVVLEIGLPVTAILSIIFLGERPSLLQTILIIGVFIGIVMVSMHSLKDFRGKIERGALLAVVAGVLMGMDNFFTGFGAKNISPMIILAIPWVICAILSLLLISKKKMWKRFTSIGKKHFWLILSMCLLNVLGWVCYSNALKNDPISIITAITEGYVFVAILLGIILNKERVKSHQIIGMAMVVIFAIILAMTL